MSDNSSPDGVSAAGTSCVGLATTIGVRALSDGQASDEPPLLDSDSNETAASASEELVLLRVGVPSRISWHDASDDIWCRMQGDAGYNCNNKQAERGIKSVHFRELPSCIFSYLCARTT